ncbi:unnamed protein product [Arctogadus glacialis]
MLALCVVPGPLGLLGSFGVSSPPPRLTDGGRLHAYSVYPSATRPAASAFAWTEKRRLHVHYVVVKYQTSHCGHGRQQLCIQFWVELYYLAKFSRHSVLLQHGQMAKALLVVPLIQLHACCIDGREKLHPEKVLCRRRGVAVCRPTISVRWFPYMWKIYWLQIKRCAFIETFKLQENILPKDKAKYRVAFLKLVKKATLARGTWTAPFAEANSSNAAKITSYWYLEQGDLAFMLLIKLQNLDEPLNLDELMRYSLFQFLPA